MPRPFYPAVDGFKLCSKCKTTKSLDNYYNQKRTKDGYYARCKECVNNYKTNLYLDEEKLEGLKNNRTEYKRKERYGIDNEDFNNLLELQRNRCAICNLVFDYSSHKTKPFIDHCHTTLKVRGLLCNNCNFALGGFKDNEDILMAAISYLRNN